MAVSVFFDSSVPTVNRPFLHLLLLLSMCRPSHCSSIDITFPVDEETAVNTKVYDLQQDRRFRPNTTFDASPGYFEVSPQGVIRVHKRLDRENSVMCPKQNLAECRRNFVVLAGQEMRVVSVTAIIHDINDHVPAWSKDDLRVNVAENEELGKRVPFQMAKDPDLGKNSVVRYELATPSEFFDVKTTKGFGGDEAPPVPQFVVKGKLDREWQAWHNLTVRAVDGMPPFKTGLVKVNIHITDENDNTPEFQKTVYEASVDEDASIETVVTTLNAVDRDEGANAKIRYKLAVSTPDEVRRAFRIDEDRGQVRVRSKLDFEVESAYTFQVIAQDGGSPPRSASARVVIKLNDKNDHKPTIVAKPYPNNLKDFQVIENVKKETIIAAVTVKDDDSGMKNNEVNCSLAPMKDFKLEFLATSVGQKIFRIYTTRSFDRETKDRYIITVTCWDGGEPSLTGYQDIDIRIIDQNDCAPRFEHGPRYDFRINEERDDLESALFTTQAIDRDEGANGRVTYEIKWPSKKYGENPLIINSEGQVFAKKKLDREQHPDGFRFLVVATDGGNPKLSSTATVTITLLDVNDNAPRFEHQVYNFKVKETSESYYGSAVGTVKATDLDADKNGKVVYTLEPHNSPFTMQPHGQIFTRLHIDRETKSSYNIKVIAYDIADDPSARKSATVPVHIEILDINDNAPVFVYPNSSNLRTRISYREPPGFRLLTVKAEDRDKDMNAKISYLIVSGNIYGVFALDKDNGDLRVVRTMLKIPKETMTLRVRATDNGQKALFKETNIMIEIDESEPQGLHGVGAGSGAFDLETNKLIIIIIVIATAIICAVLITAICFMARGTPCLFGLGVRGFSSSTGASHSRPEHVLVRPIQKTPMKSSSLQSLNTRPYIDPTVDTTTPEVRFETFLGPLRTHPEEIGDSDGDSGRGGSVKYFTNPDAVPHERHTYNNGALYVTVRRDTLNSNVSTSLV